MFLRKWREENKKSKVWLALQLGISTQAVDKIESDGLRGAKRIYQIERITGGKVRAKDLMGGKQ